MNSADRHTAKIWLITGVSGGIGLALAEAALARGDIVIGSLRQTSQSADFEAKAPGRAHAIIMDVTQSGQIREAINRAIAFYKRIDVIVNNAGVGMVGAVEETDIDEARAIFETNFFGAFQLTKAVLPLLRQQGSGHIVNISSAAGISAVPGLGIYSASKFALEGMTEALAVEVASSGITVSLVEPGAILTNFPGSSIVEVQDRIPAYSSITGQGRADVQRYYQQQAHHPEVVAQAVLSLVDTSEPTLRLVIGDDAMAGVLAKVEHLQTIKKAAINSDF